MLIRYVLFGAAALGLLLPATATAADPILPERATAAASTGASGDGRQELRTAPAQSRSQASAGSRRAAARTFQGEGFDTCQAPAPAVMDAWLAQSPYRAVGIYFGGRARACSTQTYLTADWVQHAATSGWSLLPLYVGSQAPCVTGANKNPYRIDSQDPAALGASEGRDATDTARALGLEPGSALYLDMEAYDISDTACTDTTLAFVQAWDRQVAADGYLSGFYSSADSGVLHLETARRAGARDLPDAIWYARWGVSANLTDEPSLAADAWTPNARIHQYHGSVTETYGGQKLTIDRDRVDAPVAVVGAPADLATS